jgi:hypothetical protein
VSPLHHRLFAAALLTALLLPGCTAGDGLLPADDGVPAVHVEGDALLLELDGTTVTVAEVGPDEQLLHAAVRPGHDAPITVLALTRSEGRYELRYANVLDDAVTDLYWFPWRMQVDDDVADFADVPTIPVWAPDGSSVAWLEWDRHGTRLRTVDWIDYEHTSNPSDDQAAYRVAEVPVGSQLVAWEQDSDGTPVLHARTDGTLWEIRLEDGTPVVAMHPGG